MLSAPATFWHCLDKTRFMSEIPGLSFQSTHRHAILQAENIEVGVLLAHTQLPYPRLSPPNHSGCIGEWRHAILVYIYTAILTLKYIYTQSHTWPVWSYCDTYHLDFYVKYTTKYLFPSYLLAWNHIKPFKLQNIALCLGCWMAISYHLDWGCMSPQHHIFTHICSHT